MSGKISVAGYLFTRLRQLGVGAVHGVPGDFFLKALDHLKPAGLKWVGNCNELNAGYAADGYARVKGISAVFTTMGVGEMSAFNAVAGAYAEYVPVVHIAGTPNRKLQRAKALVHHTLGDGNMGLFMDMFKNVTVAQADLQDATIAPSQIDSALERAISKRRPVYFALPSDVVPEMVPTQPLEQPLNFKEPSNDPKREENAVTLIIERIQKSQRPLILVDGLCCSFGIAEQVNELVKTTRIPTMCFPFGKGIVDESLENFYGVHAGRFGRVDNSEYSHNADLVLLFGPLLSDNNSTGFSTVPRPEVTVSFHLDEIRMPDGQIYQLHTKPLLRRLLKFLQSSGNGPSKQYTRLQSSRSWLSNLQSPNPSSNITQDHFYAHISSYLRPHDHILLANGTPLPGGRDLLLAHPSRILSSSIFLSVGHWLPAAQGVSLALQELRQQPPNHSSVPPVSPIPPKGSGAGRTILLEGDGSFQSSCQELSTIIRHRLPVTIFLLNNRGYTYERHIHSYPLPSGQDVEDPNSVGPWRYLDAPHFFGAEAADQHYPIHTHRVRTWAELDAVLGGAEFHENSGLKMVEVMVEKEDVPGKLRQVLRRAGEALEE